MNLFILDFPDAFIDVYKRQVLDRFQFRERRLQLNLISGEVLIRYPVNVIPRSGDVDKFHFYDHIAFPPT